jgi:hypothetical protein
MPTGPLHDHVINSFENGEFKQTISNCRCMIGDDHTEGPWPDDRQDDSEDESESFAGAEAIYDSSGRDEDYDFR